MAIRPKRGIQPCCAASPEIREQAKVITNQTRRIADVISRLRNLKEPKSVEYLKGSWMLDLGPKAKTELVKEPVRCLQPAGAGVLPRLTRRG